MTNRRHQITVASRFNAQDAEATFLAVKRDSFNISNKNFQG